MLKVEHFSGFQWKNKTKYHSKLNTFEIIAQDLKQTHTSTVTVLTGLYICQAVVNMHSLHGKVSLYRT